MTLTCFISVDNLRDISSNYSIGFGTFVDKPTAPYAKTGKFTFQHFQHTFYY